MASKVVAPASVRKEAKEGLELRKQYGRGGLTKSQAGKQGIASGVERAKQLANGRPLSDEDISAMYRFFIRHKAFKKYHNQDPPSNALISWKLWGGDSGQKWIKGVYKEMKMNEEIKVRRRGGVRQLKRLKIKDMMIHQPETSTKAGLQKKAKESGIDYQILKKVFMRGKRAFAKAKDKLPKGTNEYQWAFDRVNDFIKGQGTAKKADRDLAMKAGVHIQENVGIARQVLSLLESKKLIAYHGTNGNFTTFDSAKIGSNTLASWYGTGFYFTSSPSVAKTYGSKVIKVELDLKKPLDIRNIKDTSVSGSGIVRLFAKIPSLKNEKIPSNNSYTYKELNDVLNELEKDVKRIEIDRLQGKGGLIDVVFEYDYDGIGRPKKYEIYNLNKNITQKQLQIRVISELLDELFNVSVPDRLMYAISPSLLTHKLKKDGYDGVIANSDDILVRNAVEYVVFDSDRIKVNR